mmetsp:Transcript_45164/g.139737  ORF Transcript_45164/g.139737 Transcript_45164/m.139737 type:complete len:245 (+) Transcript_45164:677-1411(+)
MRPPSRKPMGSKLKVFRTRPVCAIWSRNSDPVSTLQTRVRTAAKLPRAGPASAMNPSCAGGGFTFISTQAPTNGRNHIGPRGTSSSFIIATCPSSCTKRMNSSPTPCFMPNAPVYAPALAANSTLGTSRESRMCASTSGLLMPLVCSQPLTLPSCSGIRREVTSHSHSCPGSRNCEAKESMPRSCTRQEFPAWRLATSHPSPASFRAPLSSWPPRELSSTMRTWPSESRRTSKSPTTSPVQGLR